MNSIDGSFSRGIVESRISDYGVRVYRRSFLLVGLSGIWGAVIGLSLVQHPEEQLLSVLHLSLFPLLMAIVGSFLCAVAAYQVLPIALQQVKFRVDAHCFEMSTPWRKVSVPLDSSIELLKHNDRRGNLVEMALVGRKRTLAVWALEDLDTLAGALTPAVQGLGGKVSSRYRRSRRLLAPEARLPFVSVMVCILASVIVGLLAGIHIVLFLSFAVFLAAMLVELYLTRDLPREKRRSERCFVGAAISLMVVTFLGYLYLLIYYSNYI
jgi:hypothetical protein